MIKKPEIMSDRELELDWTDDEGNPTDTIVLSKSEVETIKVSQNDYCHKEMLRQINSKLISDGAGGYYFRVSPREYEAFS